MTISRRLLLATPLLATPALAQRPWPDGPIRLVAPFPPGGSADLLCRLLQNPLQAALGVPIVVENKPGASGALGTASVARAAPDGQSFVLVFDTHVVNPALNPQLGFEARDLRGVMLVATAPMLVATANAKPYRSLADVLAAARAKPETVSYGTIGIGSLAHLTMERLQDVTKTKLIHVPYRGGGPMSAAATAGEVDMAVASVVGLGGQVGTTLRALAQTGETRSPLRPDIPTLIEGGVAGVSAKAFWGFMAPAGIAAPVLGRFQAALAEALRQPAVRQPLEGQGVDVIGSTPDEFDRFLVEQAAIWTGVVRDKKISAH
ncbi:hypothetical protein BKE38_03345 [Pseudoroseomonas deserti]|uniref:Receptor n=1 Tax=Teichococcus deserti TaxID=1817963 RepID=A0A1V2H6U1_9PROT|nr:tripartite tricarboxylate transporter substrate-binding protein [Pseudoroseomonas deserti]ONG58137.1 hypothetical protein BKE38_03345 [Pseudoroseomonas deserti]